MKKHEFTQNQLKRYCRQLIMPQIGFEGQEKLSNARVLVVGAGALGIVNLSYLTAAGVGRIGIIDNDKIYLENLQRQILYSEADFGKYKVAAAKEKLNKLNKEVEIKIYKERFNEDNAQNILKDYDIIIDGTDNIPSRFVINEYALKMNKKWCYGAVFSMNGQASVIIPGLTGCYRCFFEEEPAKENVPDCSAGGVIGVVPALIGAVQATEAIKMMIGQGVLLTNRILIYDAFNMEFDIINVKKRKNCPVCGGK